MEKIKHRDLDAGTSIETEPGKGSSIRTVELSLAKTARLFPKKFALRAATKKIGSYGTAFTDCVVAYQHSCSLRHACPS